MVKGTEKLPAKVGRFQSPNEHPFFPDYLPEPMLPALQYPKRIAQLDRMPVRTRLERWGVTDASNCPVCLFGIETRDHILLTCGYSSEIWRYVLPRLESPNVCFMNWTELLSWIKAPARGNFCTLKKIVTQSTLYHIWRQRNNILHNQVLIPPDTVFRIIDREVRNILRGRRPYNTLLFSWLKFE
ncbi:hypothetical protein F2Q68_00020186 [Brassica cretica]|uniref:chorismate mutase n=1 Tax=Brassica cretica TaxID=69181 RepID=A0A8S9FS37_BRACR|nr:hypothetical protein F2Q68_00020186 [Brassica cretica]